MRNLQSLLRKLILNLIICISLVRLSYSQILPSAHPFDKCATAERTRHLRHNHPQLGTQEAFEEWLRQKRMVPSSRQRNNQVYTIPVVVHVVHNGEEVGTGQNISYEQIRSQIDVLNEDFRRRPGTPGFNQNPVGTDVGIEFCLVSIDPDGNTLEEPGVNRINRFSAGFSSPPFSNDYLDNIIKPQTIWDPDDYMNIWVCELGRRGGGGILGVAQMPFAPSLEGTNISRAANTDGVVIHYRAFGRVGDLQAPYVLGRTTTHEVGHFFGLLHIWGDGNCSVDDFCDDTPLVDQEVYGCPISAEGCEGKNMIENYMQYTDDACMNTFTNCQRERMLTVLDHSPRRASLLQSNACVIPARGPEASFTSTQSTGCANLEVQFVDQSLNNPSQWAWSFPGGQPNSSTAQNPTIVYTRPGTYSVSLTASNAFGEDTQTRQGIIQVLESGRDTFYVQDFESASNDWEVINPDEGITWELVSVSGNTPGFKAVRVNAYEYSQTGERDQLLSPILDFSERSQITLSFRHAYRPFATTDRDSLNIYVSTNGGATFPHHVLRIAENGTRNFASNRPTSDDFVPADPTDWCGSSASFAPCNEIDLSAFAGEPLVRIAFEVVNDFGNNIYLDDIMLIGNCNSPITSAQTQINYPLWTINPNPNRGIFNIKSHIDTHAPVEIEVFDAMGKRVFIDKFRPVSHQIELDFAHFPQGNYFLRIAYLEKLSYHKLIIFH